MEALPVGMGSLAGIKRDGERDHTLACCSCKKKTTRKKGLACCSSKKKTIWKKASACSSCKKNKIFQDEEIRKKGLPTEGVNRHEDFIMLELLVGDPWATKYNISH